MISEPNVYTWDDLYVGMEVSVPFCISALDMNIFRDLSGDNSRIHHDIDFAAKNGFSSPVVYGALTVARISNLVGMHIPGDLGLATEWRIDFNNPLYVDEDAVIVAKLTHMSPAVRVVRIKFKVWAGKKLIATGTVGSKLLEK